MSMFERRVRNPVPPNKYELKNVDNALDTLENEIKSITSDHIIKEPPTPVYDKHVPIDIPPGGIVSNAYENAAKQMDEVIEKLKRAGEEIVQNALTKIENFKKDNEQTIAIINQYANELREKGQKLLNQIDEDVDCHKNITDSIRTAIPSDKKNGGWT
jgi:undecaprenyl pyrophosphate synthase